MRDGQAQTHQWRFGELVKSDFVAPWWARNRHVQTIYPRFLQQRPPLAIRREQFQLSDGDVLNLAWAGDVRQARALVVLFHGLEGSINSHYCHDSAALFAEQGYAVVVMHFRGCGGAVNLRHRAYHSGETTDAWEFLCHLEATYPTLPKLAMGFSLGANMLLKLLGERPQQKLLQAAVAVSPPLDLAACSQAINRGFSRLYQRYLLNSMLANLAEKMQKLDYSGKLKIRASDLAGIKNFRDFDQHITAPLHGFAGADDYYHKNSALPYLVKIATPTLILHAKDDPFMDQRVIPQAQQLSAKVCVELSEQGGHCGFMQGSPWRPQGWLQQRSLAFLSDFCRTQTSQEVA